VQKAARTLTSVSQDIDVVCMSADHAAIRSFGVWFRAQKLRFFEIVE